MQAVPRAIATTDQLAPSTDLNKTTSVRRSDAMPPWRIVSARSFSRYSTAIATGIQTAANADAEGITTDGSNIWVVDSKDKLAYKYDMDGAFLSSFALTAEDKGPRGITTDGTYIWVVDKDKNGKRVYKYEMNGTFLSYFALDAANAAPEGITMKPRL